MVKLGSTPMSPHLQTQHLQSSPICELTKLINIFWQNRHEYMFFTFWLCKCVNLLPSVRQQLMKELLVDAILFLLFSPIITLFFSKAVIHLTIIIVLILHHIIISRTGEEKCGREDNVLHKPLDWQWVLISNNNTLGCFKQRWGCQWWNSKVRCWHWGKHNFFSIQMALSQRSGRNERMIV